MTRTTRRGGAPLDRRGPAADRPRPSAATGSTASARPRPGAPSWLPRASLALALTALAVSVYLTVEHFLQGASLACPEGEVVSCAAVTRSDYATLLGVPVAVLGLLWCLVLVWLCLPASWRDRRLDLPRLGLSALGVAMVVYLVWAEVRLGAVCLWCTAVHVAALLLFFVLVVGRALTPTR